MKPIVPLFGLAACAATLGHLTAGVIGVFVVMSDEANKDSFVPETILPAGQRQTLNTDIKNILQNNHSQFVLMGENNHCDMRAASFLADPQILKMLADAGVKQIFLELPLNWQNEIDSIAKDTQTQLAEPNSSTCGPAIGQEQDRITTNLIRNAQAQGIRVFAADIDNPLWSMVLSMNAGAMTLEAAFLEKMGFHHLSHWWAVRYGLKPFLEDRFDNREDATLVKAHTEKNSRSLTLFGDGHIFAAGPKTFRSNLPNCVAFSFYDQSQDGTGIIYGNEKEMAEFTYIPFNPPNYIINLTTGHVESYTEPQQPKPNTSSADIKAQPG